MKDSAAVVQNNVIYNIGGYPSSQSVLWCSLASNDPPNWKSMELQNHSFKGYCVREAFAVGNKIVYFGCYNHNATFVLEKEEEEEKLRVVRQDEGFNFSMSYNPGSCVFKKEIYAFENENYTKVHRYSLETGKWNLYYEQ